MQQPVILVFDSGLGGITVYRQVRALLPEAAYIYVADNAGFPYGAWEEEGLIKRITDVLGHLIDDQQPDLVVVACNTASTIALRALRERFSVPFVGTVPAVKVAAECSQSKVFSVLATAGTVRRRYTRDLISSFAPDCEVALVGAAGLAEAAEQKMRGEDVDLEQVRQMIKPCFVEFLGRRTDYIALACTHFPLLAEELEEVSPWPVTFIDPAPAIARQVQSLFEALDLKDRDKQQTGNAMVLTQQMEIAPALQAFLDEQGFGGIYCFPVDTVAVKP